MGKSLELPAGYRMVCKSGLSLVVREGYADSFEGFVIPEESEVQGPKSNVGHAVGRRPLTPYPLRGGSEERALVRRYTRGGFLGRFLKEQYFGWGVPRPLEELKVSEYARSVGIATPEVLAAAFERVTPFSYKGAVAVREISAAADVEAVLLQSCNSRDKESLDKKRRIASSLGILIAKMHAAGIYHADLHLKNVLVSWVDGNAKLSVLDLDAARIRQPLSRFRRCLNLIRLLRSAQKVNRKRRIVTRTDAMRFLRAYAGSSADARTLMITLQRMLPAWRLKWMLSDILGV